LSGGDQVQAVASDITTAAGDNQSEPTVTTVTVISPAAATDSDESV